jgi:2-keto-4-pentenoate hydratase
MTDHSKTIAAALMAARRDSVGLAAYPGPMPETLAESYAIQDAALALDGRAVGGWKLGRVAPQFEEALGASRFAGPILAHEIVMAGDDAADMAIFAEGFGAAESEFMIQLGAVGDGDYDAHSIRDVVTAVRVGVEIASSPFQGIGKHGPVVTASDFGNNKSLLLGPELANWREADILNMPVETWIDGERVGAATAAPMLDGPFGAAAFLVRVLRERGLDLPAGTWVSTGAVTGIHQVQPGQQVEARFGDDLRVRLNITG